ncbi:MAG: polymerase III, alpha subunit protein [Candidatus Gottesmanbacteria bacterium GW2011_GWB1_43_11]|uniref:DNA polymerase III subunit alpha n=1 Tax=Candidatus Gottesmanbacteria bacterium GW2011_GWB1_43_11 TaxID=1618446 RepID=A0A0G1CKN6_9BACT|nr:MAG: polymerase III, alpha subunit protein [Candidatus Gottesmanbacteria bacterium GW2011_GWA2_42_16]KKS55812.1 MAG: polymerase III, alpha subunit protein [Candidatus Gottesmanbacteria bacterium GW2011_GWA1_42_26]KKS82020.1 MAG: polymerase III catalytic subunit, DnaE type, DNA polymerase III subunit alpha protein [Candidatus Gottesmanbacteria bacterium GW2011_GWC1_43_10]KKS86380.1 MAG: polymerase III, alpha subunit protein [Candidatus Gottesmanbacteria bacterium GW2011_GWB1_43_11]
MPDFVHLHTHSEFSLLDGLCRMEDLVARTKALGMNTLALTDHGAMYGSIKFYQQALVAGIKPIIGVEIYVAARSRFDKQPDLDRDQYHLVLLAQNTVGYKNLLKLVTLAHLEGYYYKPRIDLELLRQHCQGLICLSACLAGEVPSLLLAGQDVRAEAKAKQYLEIFGQDHYFLELQMHPNIKELATVNEKLVQLSRKLGIPLVATNDVHYIEKEDAEAHEVLLCVQTQHTMLEKNRPLSLAASPDFYLRSPEEMTGLFIQYPDAVANTRKIADMCELTIPLGKWILPPFIVPASDTPETHIKKMVYQGAQNFYGHPLPAHVVERIDYELSIIGKKGYATYFLIVADFVNWAKKQGILVGPGRGSAAGSVVSFILGITGLDPFYFSLPFERFLNPERPSPPDIDLDFADDRRDEVIAYVTQKYGSDKVAQIITFGTMEARAAVRDVGRALGMPYAQPDRIAKLIPIGAQGFAMTIAKALEISPDLRVAYQTEAETKRLLDLARRLEGVSRHASVHAAGVVIADKPLVEYTPLQKETKGEKIVTQYDMYTVGEDGIGLLKMDFLGLRNLTIINQTLKFIKEQHKETIDIQKIPLNDKSTFELLAKGETTGIFQLESAGMRRYIKELKPTTIFDMMAMVALYRPGPMQVIPEFIARKHDPKKISYIHPRLENVLKQSYGLICYQDDVLLTAITLAGYSWGDADKLRKAVGKKIPAEMKKQQEKFIAGCRKNGITAELAAEIFHLIEPFAGYGFNKAHAASYAMIAYQTAYLKTRYPVEFMTAVLTAESRSATGPAREEKVGLLVGECKRMGIQLLGPDINRAHVEFTIEKDTRHTPCIRFGLSAIKNVGTAAIETILIARRSDGDFESIRDFVYRVDLSKVNKKTLESLIKAGAFDQFGSRAGLLTGISQIVEEVQKDKKHSQSGQIGLFETDTGRRHDTKLPETEEFTKSELLRFEKDMFGFYFTEHPLTPIFSQISQKVSHQIADLTSADVGATVVIGGIVSQIKKIITKSSGQEMAFIRLSDLSGVIEVVVFPRTFALVKNLLIPDTAILVKARVDEKDDRLTLIANDIFTLQVN